MAVSSIKNKEIAQNTTPHLGEVLSKLMADNYIDTASLSHHTGIPIPTINRLRSNTNCNPTIATLIPIANFFEITINQLIGEESIDQARYFGINPDNLKITLVPIIDIEQADEKPILRDSPEAEKYEWVASSAKLGVGAFALVANGSRAIPQYPSGTILIFDRNIVPKDVDYVIVRLKKGQQPILRQLFIDGEDHYFKPVSEFGDVVMSKDFEILGVMIQALMNYRNAESL